jgi:two-component system sensor histidine kinase KdpD
VPQRGRLKLYAGYAAGVGKTWQLLHEAHALRARGVDVVIGLVEPHPMPEPQLNSLEVMPRRRVTYHDVTVEEMDLDALLRRRPQVAMVDDLAHTNVPGGRHPKRYQDVLELLDAGVSVIGAFNIQELDSLSELVERLTGTPVRETLPDSFVRQADPLVCLDLAIEDLQERRGSHDKSSTLTWGGHAHPRALASPLVAPAVGPLNSSAHGP